MNERKHIIVLGFILCLFASACNNRALKIFKSSSARSQYLNTLDGSGIGATKIGSEWKRASQEVLLDAATLEFPVTIQGSFLSKSINARAWKIQLEQGASVNIHVNWQARDSSELIVDLLEGPEWSELVSYSAQDDSVKFEADKSGDYLLRIQPELFGEGNFQVMIYGVATYAVFPVQGKNSRAIQSKWHDPRDGGRREHEGVDIFAARGTPVLAPVDGVVTAVRDRGLGGKQVWVRDNTRNWNLYFAHLDSQLVRNLQRVSPGDTLGLVGNTGNARTTPPHLHFGIYQNGAINPYPAIETNFQIASPLPVRTLSSVMKVSVSQANLRAQPNTKSPVISELEANEPVFLEAETSEWFQVKTVDGKTGFIYENLVSPIDSASLEKKSTYAFTGSPTFPSDSLLVDLEQFYKIGGIDGFDLIKDDDGNILYLRREDR